MPAPRDGSQYQAREERLLGEFLTKFFPTARVVTRARLGSPPISPTSTPLEEPEKRLLKAWSRWADALVILPSRVILIEAEILPSPGIVSTLELYGRLFRSDPDYTDYHRLPLTLMLLWAFRDPVLEQIAHERGVEVRIYDPPWVVEALRARFKTSLPSRTRPTPTPKLGPDSSAA